MRFLSFVFIFVQVIQLFEAKDDGMCEDIGDLDVYLLIPTSAHVNRTRLNEVKDLVSNIFRREDFSGTSIVKPTTILYKRIPKLHLAPDDVVDYNDFRASMDEVAVKARAADREDAPTFASEGLQYFISHYKSEQASGRRRNVPAVLLFFLIETLHSDDMRTMAQYLVKISSGLDVFSFLFVGNPQSRNSSPEPVISLPHESWNSLAVEDSSDILKYDSILRRTMCRAARGNLCLMMKEASKAVKIEILQRSATNRVATNNRPAGPAGIVVTPNSCCGRFIFSKPYNKDVQKCCVGTSEMSTRVIEDDLDC